MDDILNNIRNVFNELINNIYFITALIGIIIIIIIFYDSEDKEIYNCIQKFDTSQIYEFPNMLSDLECDKIIELSKDKVKRSTVIGDSHSRDVSNVRTSSNTFLSDDIDPLMNDINQRIENIIGINRDHYEDLQVVHYKPGQFYKAHWDACDPKKDSRCTEDFKKGGLRFATFILYLNDDMEGGETEFPLINKSIKPEKGKGVLFFNLEDNLSNRKELSKHAGLPPTKGEKWMCNKWIRLGKFTE